MNYSMIATDRPRTSPFKVEHLLVSLLASHKLLIEDEDGDYEVSNPRAAAAACFLLAYEIQNTVLIEAKDEEGDLVIVSEEDNDELYQMVSETAQLLHNAASRNASVILLRAQDPHRVDARAH